MDKTITKQKDKIVNILCKKEDCNNIVNTLRNRQFCSLFCARRRVHTVVENTRKSILAKELHYGQWMIGKKLTLSHRNNIGKGLSKSYREGRTVQVMLGKHYPPEHGEKIKKGLAIFYATHPDGALRIKQALANPLIKEKMRLGALRHTPRFKDTKIELKINDWLKTHLIENKDYFRNHLVENIANVDFYIPTLKLIIQCDGDY